MKILIIGSLGFIGSHCLKHFSSMHDTYGCDILPDQNNKKHFILNPETADFDIIFKQQCFDLCINCAGSAVVNKSFEEPVKDYYLNTIIVYRILDAIRKNYPICKFVNISSAAVYGNPVTIPILETATLNPLSPYGFHKQMAEIICQEYTKIYNIPTCSLRIFSAYGTGLRKQLIWDILTKVHQSNNITLFGTGQETRDFIYIDDIIDAIDITIQQSSFIADIVNIASGQQVSVSEIIKTIKNVYPTNFNYSFNNQTRIGDPLHWQADISRIVSWGFNTKVSLQQGISNVISWFLNENI